MPQLTYLAILVLAASLVAQTTQPTPATQPTGATPAAATAQGSEEALALAQKVYEFAGGAEGWAQVQNLVFTFNRMQRVFWDLRLGMVRVESVVEDPEAAARLPFDVAIYDTMLEEAISPEGARGNAEAVAPAWINHTYWLLAPLKVLDPGVTLSIDPPEEGDAEGWQRLRLSFDEGTGLTSQNQYVLHVEAKTGRVTAWDFYPQPGAEKVTWGWEGYQQIGSLYLSLYRPSEGRAPDIRLEEVMVNVLPPRDVWTSSENQLTDMPTEWVRVEVLGILTQGAAAITGADKLGDTLLRAGDLVYELDLGDNEGHFKLAQVSHRQHVRVKGVLRLVREPGELNRRVILVESMSRAGR